MFEQIWPYVLLLSICIAALIVWKTQIKGYKLNRSLTVVAIGRWLILSFVFFGLISLPLINQPRISNQVILPVGTIFVVFGIALMILAIRELTKTKFFMKGIGTPERLITTGPFAIMRHPATAGFISIFIGWSLVWGAIYCLIFIAPIIVVGMVIENIFEERNLEKAFGDEYKVYKKRVGMYFPKIGRKN